MSAWNHRVMFTLLRLFFHRSKHLGVFTIVWPVLITLLHYYGYIANILNILGKVRFFLGGEGWGILVFFSQKSVGPPLRFN